MVKIGRIIRRHYGLCAKGYRSYIDYDIDNCTYHGRLLGIDKTVRFSGVTYHLFIEAFNKAISCEIAGKVYRADY